ncbi:MAG: hypothetical protein JXR97_04015 [Planctomycetes bacterium]|nr:hypothetical protein [Planctomycetota bacterium]
MRRYLLTIILIAFASAGCNPTIVYRIDTGIAPDGSCYRKAIIKGKPNEKTPTQTVKIKDYLELPQADLYETFVLTPNQLILGGRFDSPDQMPQDFVKLTPYTDKRAENNVQFRRIDLVLIQVMDFEEKFSDIVNRKTAEESLDKLVNMVVDEAMVAANDLYGSEYDLTGARMYLKEQLPALALELYARLWEIRRAKRGGISFLGESTEWRRVISDIALKFGVKITPSFSDDKEKENREAIGKFVAGKLEELTSSKKADAKPLRADFIGSKEDREKFLTALQESIKRRHGSTKAFTDKIEKILPEVFGAFMISDFSPLPTNPHFDIQARLALPGHVVQTNGLRDIDGRILWSFDDREMSLTGYSMWARSLVINNDMIRALGLKGFPGHITTVEYFFQIFRTSSPHEINEELADLLRECVKEKSLEPLKRATLSDSEVESKKRLTASAKSLYSLLKRYAPAESEEMEPELPHEDKAPEIDDTDNLDAPGK